MTSPATQPTLIQLRVIPNGKRSEIVGKYGDAWKLRVIAAPEKGRANKEIVALLSKILDVSRVQIEVIRGLAARDKVVAVQGLSMNEITQKLSEAQR